MKAFVVCLLALAACQDQPLQTSATSALSGPVPNFAISPLTGTADPGSTSSTSSGHVLFVGAWNVPLGLAAGDSVTSISAIVRDNGPSNGVPTTDSNAVIVMAVSDISGVIAQANTDSSGREQIVTLALQHVVTSGESLRIRFVSFGSSAHSSSIGLIEVGPLHTRVLQAVTAVPEQPGQPGAVFVSGRWTFVADNNFIYYPVIAAVDETIDGFRWWINKTKGGPVMSASVIEIDSQTGQQVVIDGSIQQAASAATGLMVLDTGVLAHRVMRGKSYVLRVAETGASGSDTFVDAELIYN